jgi:hypothetical protein
MPLAGRGRVGRGGAAVVKGRLRADRGRCGLGGQRNTVDHNLRTERETAQGTIPTCRTGSPPRLPRSATENRRPSMYPRSNHQRLSEHTVDSRFEVCEQ